MSVVKVNMVIELKDIAGENLISVKNIIRKERLKIWMVNPKILLHILWEHGFTESYKDVCTYYTLQGRADNCGNKIDDKSLRQLMRNCLNFNEEETLTQNNASQDGTA